MQPCAAAGVFTQSSFAGPSVLVSRLHVAHGTARAMVVISKNANVATGAQGLADAQEVVAGVAAALGCSPTTCSSRPPASSVAVPDGSHPRRPGRPSPPLPGTDAAARWRAAS
jgi:hypothetical protein